VENTLEKHLAEGVACCVVDVADDVKGAAIIATVTQEVDKNKIIKKLSEELSNIELPKQFLVIEELPMMGTGKIDFRTVTGIVQEMIADKAKQSVSGVDELRPGTARVK
ncbi:MAG TPA: hypothetical protein VJ877_07665, partial [Bacteroidales bacterium]|nr:hypothetical protein [Bacteroidales bacterium]